MEGGTNAVLSAPARVMLLNPFPASADISLVFACIPTRSQSCTLGNGLARKTVSFTADHGLEPIEWTDEVSSFNFISPALAHHGFNEFHFTALKFFFGSGEQF